MDTLTPAERSVRMSKIRGKNTRPELTVRSVLHAQSYRFRLHKKSLPGSPDLVFAGRKKAVFIHGCFWHAHSSSKCKIANKPKTRRSYWSTKFSQNISRDRRTRRALRQLGWVSAVVWECEVRNSDRLIRRLKKFLGPPNKIA